MASELRTPYQGSGGTLYGVVRKLSDLTKVWNGTAFETYVNGSVANYDVPLTDQGGDVYAADFPAGITAGDYLVVIYEQAGGSPAITDLILRSYPLHWNGSAASDASTVSLDAYALSDLASLKLHMRVTSSTDDTLMTTLLNAISAEIERVTGRQFKARDRRIWLNLNGQKRLVIPNPPIQSVYRIAYGTNNALSIQYTGAAIEARATVYRNPESPDAGGIRLVSYASTGARTSTDVPFATYASTSSLATQIATVSGWTASAAVNTPAANLHSTGGGDAKTAALQLTYPDQFRDDYSVNEQAGTIEFADCRGGSYGWWPGDGRYGSRRFAGGHQSLLVECRTGWEEIPADVSLLCREMVKEAWYSGKMNTAAQSGSLGPLSWAFTQQQEDRVRSRLDKYVLDGFVGCST